MNHQIRINHPTVKASAISHELVESESSSRVVLFQSKRSRYSPPSFEPIDLQKSTAVQSDLTKSVSRDETAPKSDTDRVEELVKAQYYLGCLNLDRREYSLAIARFQKAIALDPSCKKARYALSVAQKSFQKKIEDGDWLEELPIDSFNKNIRSLESCWQQPSSSIGCLFHLTDDTSVQNTEEPLQQPLHSAERSYQLARRYERASCFTTAKSHYQKAIEIDRKYWQAHFGLGNIFAQQQQWQPALTAYLKVQKLKPDYFWSYNNAGNVFSELSYWEEAKQQYLKALHCQYPPSGWCYYHLAIAYFQLENIEKAAWAYSLAEEKLKTLPDADERIAAIKKWQNCI